MQRLGKVSYSLQHFFTVLEQYPDWGWFKHPHHFQGSFYVSADTESVNMFLTHTQTANDSNEIEINNDNIQDQEHQKEEPLLQIPTNKVCSYICHI